MEAPGALVGQQRRTHGMGGARLAGCQNGGKESDGGECRGAEAIGRSEMMVRKTSKERRWGVREGVRKPITWRTDRKGGNRNDG